MTELLPLKEQLKALELVQEIDLKIDQVKKRKEALPLELQAIDLTLSQLKQSFDSKTNHISENEKILRQTDAAIELNNDRNERAAKKLEGVQNSQEFQAASKEIEQLKKLNETLEDQKKRLLTDIEAIKKEIETVRATLQETQAKRDAQAGEISSQQSSLNADQAKLEKERAQKAVGILGSTLARYDRVRGVRQGIAVAAAIGGRCKGCNMFIPPQMFNELQKFQNLISCPSCQRILFIPAGDAPAAT